jgi:NADPH-dependent 2,4-dienoyl-CoA reductase/sulfur reductase-like enzyme
MSQENPFLHQHFGAALRKLTPTPHLPPGHAWQVIARLELLEANVLHPEVVVVGGGYAGVELAAVVAERLAGRARIKLLTAGGLP